MCNKVGILINCLQSDSSWGSNTEDNKRILLTPRQTETETKSRIQICLPCLVAPAHPQLTDTTSCYLPRPEMNYQPSLVGGGCTQRVAAVCFGGDVYTVKQGN